MHVHLTGLPAQRSATVLPIVAASPSDPGTSRRRVLAVMPDWPWPATTGGRMRAVAIVEALGAFADVTVLATQDPQGDAPAAWRSATAAFARRHASVPARLADAGVGLLLGRHVALQRAIASGMPGAFSNLIAGARPALVILGRGFGGPFIEIARQHGARVVLEADESLVDYNRSILRSKSTARARLRAAMDLLAVGRMERRDFTRADEVWLANESELARVQASLPSVKLRLVPNIAPPIPFEPAGPVNAVGFVGFFRHPPNEEAAGYLARSVMPVVRAKGGPGDLRLIGRDPTNGLLALAARDSHVAVTGEVADVVPELRAAGVLAMPITSGGGSRIKALEAAAAGVPIVSTAFGMAGLALLAGRDFLDAESPSAFAEAITALANDADLRERLTSNARAAVAANHSREALARAIQDAIARVPGTCRGVVDPLGLRRRRIWLPRDGER